MRTRLRPFWVCAVVAACGISAVHAQAGANSAAGTPLIDSAKINNNQLTSLKGTVPLRVANSVDAGAMNTTTVIPSMTLLLRRSPDQQKQFDAYLSSLNNPASPNFHKWLKPSQIGQKYGPNTKDIAAVKSWMTAQGLTVKSVSPTGTLVHFAGPVGAVQSAFHTQLHQYMSGGKLHFANATEQQLPSALTSVVAGAVSLSDFFPESLVKNTAPVKRNAQGKWTAADGPSSNFNFSFNGNIFNDVVPADLNTIYNVNPLWQEDTPIRGAGQTVAVLERTDVLDADVATFRQTFMPPDAGGVFAQVHPAGFEGDTSCLDPGTNGDEGEAALDAEWGGAAAPDANVILASCADNGSVFGPFQAAENLLEQDAPPSILSLSYGECELISAVVGDHDLADELWSTAAAEGVTVFVSSGDAGSAGCDQGLAASTFGIEVNGLGSTPYNVSVGGTDFNDLKNTSKYWAPANGELGSSALSYIPEQTWNDSCASSQLYPLLKFSDPVTSCNSATGSAFLSTAGGGGGPSFLEPQPTWQTGVAGMSQITTRVTPDVSLFAANGIYGHALIFCMSDASEGGTNCNYIDPQAAYFNSAGGTSFAAPTMAGIQALINQKAGASHGNISPTLYDLARKQYGSVGSPSAGCGSDGAGANCVFHDVTVGDIDVPCFANTADCYTTGTNQFGAVSSGGLQSLNPAWQTGAGYDYATGLGSVNVQHLVNAFVAQDARSNIPRTWDLYGQIETGAPGVGPFHVMDGHSNILAISSTTGSALMVQMNGGTVVSTNPWDNMFEPGDQVKAIPTDLFTTGLLAGQTVMESDNPTDHTANLAVYSYGWLNFRLPAYPAGWTLIGSGVVDSSGISEEIWRNDSTGQIGFWSINCSGTVFFGQFFNMACDRTIGATIPAASGYTPRLADLNGDGYIDIVWTGPNNDLYFWINDGTGNFIRSYQGTFPAGWTLEGAGQVVGSGDTDLIWTNASTNQMGWWTMNGTTVVDRQIRSVASGYSIASIEDFDGDGLADILWIGTAGDTYIWQGTGGGFVSQRVADGQGTPFALPSGYVVQKNRLQGVLGISNAPISPDVVATRH
jgi:Pro-kumamolisin, activation domain/FG-GAP-like repeat